jgi:WD40 repeat protein
LVTGGEDKILYLWDYPQQKIVSKFKGHTKGVTICAFSPDNNKIISGGDDFEVREWNAKTARLLAVWKRHEAAVTSVAYTPNGRYIVTASTDSIVLILDAVTKQEICAFACRGRVTSMDVSKNGKTLCCGDGSGQLYILEPVGLL